MSENVLNTKGDNLQETENETVQQNSENTEISSLPAKWLDVCSTLISDTTVLIARNSAKGTKYDKHVTNLWEEVNDPDFTPTEGTSRIGTRSRPRPPPGPKDTRLIKLPRISPT